MKIRHPWIMLTLLLCVAAIAGVVLPNTLAYIAANSNTIQNSFTVAELPPLEDLIVPVQVKKTVYCVGDETIGPGGFSFRLMNLDTGDITTMTSFIDGTTTTSLTFTEADLGKTFRYRLYEFEGTRQHVTYDKTVYDISIRIALNEHHELAADITVNGRTVTEIVAQFANLYAPEDVPDTGDHDQPILWLAVMLTSAAGLFVLGRKKIREIRRPSWT